ncbi:MAG: STAS domain-containing protein [Pirellulales bacterium]
MSAERHFTAERAGDVLCVVPLCDVTGVNQDAVQAGVAELLAMLAGVEPRHVVFDFREVEYFGSAMLETMLTLWRHVRSRGGRLAVCNLSEAEREVLATVKFNTLWPIGETREEALQAVRGRA